MSIKETVVRTTSMSLLKIRKYAPEILTVGALVSGGAAIITSIKQTTTVKPCFKEWDEYQNTVKEYDEKVKFVREDFEKHKDDPGYPIKELPEDEYTEFLRLHDRVTAGTKTAISIINHYALPLAFTAISGACILGLYNVWRARYTAVVAAYTGLQTLYENYKQTVREKYGEAAEKDCTALAVDRQRESKFNHETGTIERTYANASQYARIFDESSVFWKRDAGANFAFLQRQQSLANNLLKINGSLFLNEVYDMLGFPRTKAGSIVGWVHEPGRQQEVDFGFWRLDDERSRAFINGWENSVLLDFNVDGLIYDLI